MFKYICVLALSLVLMQELNADDSAVVNTNGTVTTKRQSICMVKKGNRKVYACCAGYEKRGKKCIPVCIQGCNRGNYCVAPDQCECHPGYKPFSVSV